MRASPAGRAKTIETVSQIPAIELQNVSKSFGAVKALQEVSFSIPQGQVVALLGPNGAVFFALAIFAYRTEERHAFG